MHNDYGRWHYWTLQAKIEWALEHLQGLSFNWLDNQERDGRWIEHAWLVWG